MSLLFLNDEKKCEKFEYYYLQGLYLDTKHPINIFFYTGKETFEAYKLKLFGDIAGYILIPYLNQYWTIPTCIQMKFLEKNTQGILKRACKHEIRLIRKYMDNNARSKH